VPPPTFRAPTGTFDVLPPASARYETLVARFATLVERAGYGLVISPMFEDLGVFQRVGESTDVVRKEMYDFHDKGSPPRHLALRPEGTASVVRAFVEHRPPVPWKAWYVAPSFRYERPQAGRFRQHHQLGVEALGSADADLDVEVIALLHGYFDLLGLRQISLKVNSLGDGVCRPAYRAELEAFLATKAGAGLLCDEHATRYTDNPLRVLDCKKPACIAATADAPYQVDRLCDPCRAHFARVQEGLRLLGIDAVLDPRLVRGLDYYTRTTFEFAAGALGSAQDAVGGGGRYDGLAEELGGPATPGIGFGCGIERVLLACDAEGITLSPDRAIDVFVVDTVGGQAALALTHELRSAGVGADRAFDGRSLKAQFRMADRSGAALAVVVGEDELARDVVAIKPMRGAGEQREVRRDEMVDYVRKMLSR
jgi:histidyl-tRNA synthetase